MCDRQSVPSFVWCVLLLPVLPLLLLVAVVVVVGVVVAGVLVVGRSAGRLVGGLLLLLVQTRTAAPSRSRVQQQTCPTIEQPKSTNVPSGGCQGSGGRIGVAMATHYQQLWDRT